MVDVPVRGGHVHVVGAPHRGELARAAGQEVPGAHHLVRLRVRPHVSHADRVRVGVDAQQLDVPGGGRPEHAYRLGQAPRGQRAHVRAAAVHERNDHGLAAELAQRDRGAELIGQREVRCRGAGQAGARVHVRVRFARADLRLARSGRGRPRAGHVHDHSDDDRSEHHGRAENERDDCRARRPPLLPFARPALPLARSGIFWHSAQATTTRRTHEGRSARRGVPATGRPPRPGRPRPGRPRPAGGRGRG